MAQNKKVPVKAKQSKAKGAGAKTIEPVKKTERSKIEAKARGPHAAAKSKAAPAKTASAHKVAGKPARTFSKAATSKSAAPKSVPVGADVAKAVARPGAGAAKSAVPTAKPSAAAPAKHAVAVKHPAVAAKHPTAAARPAAPTVPVKPAAAAAAVAATRPPVPQRAMTAAMSKPAQPKISSPMTPKDLAVKAAEARQSAQAAKKPISQRHGFKTNEFIVYPAHGVGRIVGIEEQEIAGMSLELFVITFDKDKMTLRVPTGKLQSVGMRKLADDEIVGKAMETLKGRARVKRTMWSRRAQEYEAKINSGDLVSIAEVVRDLYRSETQPEQSYSERQLYEAALDRMAREIAAVERLDERGAVQRITEVLSKSARGRRLAAEEAAEPSGDTEVKAA